MNIKWTDWSKSNDKDNTRLLYFIAAQELSWFSDSTLVSLKRGFLTREVVAVDLEPFKLPYHFRDMGQKYHFMRISQEQSNSDALEDAANLIRQKARKWLSNMRRAYYGPKHHGRSKVNTRIIRQHAVSELAIALHALQDSFSPGHTQRKKYNDPHYPGEITDIYVYKDQDHDKHSEHDFEAGSVNSVLAQSAVYASAELMRLCASSLSRNSTTLLGWKQFQNRWLKLEN